MISIFRYTLILFTFCLCGNAVHAAKKPDQPKLVVGIVVDQMRYDYLYRYWHQYGNDGFKKLIKEGFQFKNTHYNYAPTFTGPGHAFIYTGTYPAIHGIIGNDWYVRESLNPIYCTEDKGVACVGADSEAGRMSPQNLLATTITDELRLATNKKAKVIGICLKDRGAILPAGHVANAAYWYEAGTGSWISSTYYMNDLPEWVKAFNQKQLAAKYLNQDWNTLLSLSEYHQSTPDDNAYEAPFGGEAKPVFPHKLAQLKGSDFGLLRSTPFGNTFTKDFALEAIKAENLGKNGQTDFLALSFSSPDYIGHQFGPNSIEVQDTYLRLDKELAEVLTFLEKHIGKENVLVFLTADHGAAHNPVYLQDLKIPAGYVYTNLMKDSLNQFLHRKYGKEEWVLNFINEQVYLNRSLIAKKNLDLRSIQQEVATYMLGMQGVARTATAFNLLENEWTHGLMHLVQNGYSPRRSGDVLVILEPGWLESYGGRKTGTTHGSVYTYDTQVPLLFYGWKVKKGESAQRANITDIAPTLANWLNIQQPNGCTGKPLQEYMK